MIIYLATNLILYEEEHIIGAYSTSEATIHAALSGKIMRLAYCQSV